VLGQKYFPLLRSCRDCRFYHLEQHKVTKNFSPSFCPRCRGVLTFHKSCEWCDQRKNTWTAGTTSGHKENPCPALWTPPGQLWRARADPVAAGSKGTAHGGNGTGSVAARLRQATLQAAQAFRI